MINKIYTYGLFDIKEEYKSPGEIIDGGGWSLQIDFADGTIKTSDGSNNSPNAFRDCAKAFYDLCLDGVVAYVPTQYHTPPNVSCSFNYTAEGNNTSYGFDPTKRLNYKWNGFESINIDIYLANKEYNMYFTFQPNIDYKLSLFTSNYGDYDRFTKCTVKSYNFDQELSDEKLIYSHKWFKRVEFDLEMNKIYFVKLEFRKGDFVEYTFNTKTE